VLIGTNVELLSVVLIPRWPVEDWSLAEEGANKPVFEVLEDFAEAGAAPTPFPNILWIINAPVFIPNNSLAIVVPAYKDTLRHGCKFFVRLELRTS
jgi:hypothetical protein